MSDIAKLIDESIESVMSEGIADSFKDENLGKTWDSAKKMAKGGLGEKLYDKLHPEKKDLAFETVKKLAKKNRELQGMGVKEHLAAAGSKAIKATKDTAEDLKDKAVGVVKDAKDMDVKGHLVAAGKKAASAVDDAVKEHPYLSAATAAALAAGAGGLAAVKRMRKAGKK